MRTTLEIDDHLLSEAMRVTGCRTKTEAVRLGLESLVHGAARRRLAALSGAVPSARAGRRRRAAKPE